MQQQSKDASGTTHCDKGCIIGIDGGAKWTTDDHPSAYKLNPTESAAIANAFKTKNWSTFQSSGIHLEGEKFQFLRVEDDRTVMAKKKGKGAVTMQCSKTAIVIGHTAEGCQQGNVNKAVNVIAEYLDGQNM